MVVSIWACCCEACWGAKAVSNDHCCCAFVVLFGFLSWLPCFSLFCVFFTPFSQERACGASHGVDTMRTVANVTKRMTGELAVMATFSLLPFLHSASLSVFRWSVSWSLGFTYGGEFLLSVSQPDVWARHLYCPVAELTGALPWMGPWCPKQSPNHCCCFSIQSDWWLWKLRIMWWQCSVCCIHYFEQLSLNAN